MDQKALDQALALFEGFKSDRAILENAAGNVIASGIIYTIAKFLSGH